MYTFLPESMLMVTLPYLTYLGLYTPEVTWLQWLINPFIISYNYIFDLTIPIFNNIYSWTINIITPIYIWTSYIIVIPYYIIYSPWIFFTSLITSIVSLFAWLSGVITILIGVKLWVLWDVISNEANTIMINLNLVNPVTAYIMAILYHGIIRPRQMVMSIGVTYFIDYVKLILPTVQNCYDLLSWIVTGRATVMWNMWTSFGHHISYMTIYPISLAGVLIDPVQFLIWINRSILDHGIVRPA